MTDPDKPLRLTSKRRKAHAAGASRRLLLGFSAASATVLASVMANAQAEKQASAIAPETTTTLPEPIIIHVPVTRPWVAAPPPTQAVASRTYAAPRNSAAATPATSPARVSSGAAATPVTSATPPPAAAPAPTPVVTSPPPAAPPTTASRAS
jgi:hypothetical protein